MSITNDQFDAIKRKYDQKQLASARLASERLEYINTHVDGYKELTDTIVSVSMERAKRALEGDKSALEDLSSLIQSLSDQRDAVLMGAGYPKDYLEKVYECPDCKDTGYIGNEKCHCLKQEINNLLYEQSNINEVLKNVDFSMISDKYYSGEDLIHFKDSYDMAVRFVNDFKKDYQNLIFYGTVGTGKSLLSACIAKELLAKGYSVIYFSAISLMEELSKQTFDYKNKSFSEGNSLYESDLLIIDDLGTEMNNNFTISSLFSLLNERAIRKKAVVISTNLTYEDLRDRYTDRIFSRLTGGYNFCRMSGPDIRIAKKLTL
jgi:DNA replication protein DnaC